MIHTQLNQFDLRKDERGNALFLILIAVALFAALSYAVTQSGRGSGTIDKEQSLISSSQITQFPAAVRTGVTRMIITGTTVGTLDFTTAPTNSADTEVFGTSGGGVVYQDPPANIGGATAWTFLDAAHATDGWYIGGVGTDTVTTGREVIAVLDGVSSNICSSILKGLGLSSTPLVESVAVTFVAGTNGEDGTAAGPSTFFAWNALATPDPQPFACTRNGAAGNYVYYHALVEQ